MYVCMYTYMTDVCTRCIHGPMFGSHLDHKPRTRQVSISRLSPKLSPATFYPGTWRGPAKAPNPIAFLPVPCLEFGHASLIQEQKEWATRQQGMQPKGGSPVGRVSRNWRWGFVQGSRLHWLLGRSLPDGELQPVGLSCGPHMTRWRQFYWALGGNSRTFLSGFVTVSYLPRHALRYLRQTGAMFTCLGFIPSGSVG